MDPTGKVNYSLWGKPVVMETAADLMFCMVPIWVAITVGLVVGWSWKPQWVSLFLMGIRSRPRLVWGTPPGFGARRFWLAVMAVSSFPMWKEAWKKFSAWMWPPAEVIILHSDAVAVPSALVVKEETKKEVVTVEDLARFMKMLDCTDGGPTWQPLMEKSVPGMAYQAWRREPEMGPTEYRSRTVFEDMTPELVRDFFWDDEFREHWDDMLIFTKTWEECEETGSTIGQWVRKYPFFCKDREYIIGRRIWESNRTFYCITQGAQYNSIPRRHSPRRVDVYFSSWRVRAVESAKGDGQMTACEVLLFHHEEMGIQKDLAKLGVRQGMWGCVKKMEPGIRKYKAERGTNKPLSPSARSAHIMTKVPPHLLNNPEQHSKSAEPETTYEVIDGKEREHQENKGYLKWIVIGGAVALACGIDKGAVGKFLVFGVAKRLGRAGRRL
ncbi:hypothetical protein KC19_10G163100 [Ceratodon purpureus]|uniref:START domain-containing protein n=1 Tax=Ceratodon purpureus TaxID=3225 RepID=A0A8T0GKZ2_CERPU|nr:hypothetical protein KC19_10G163100 [Ceratodon purpureus]